ncbi:MAG: HlyD family efflux transporter periplasmic adaptor subunit [Pseudonocardiaceae bacterium]
MPEPAHARPRHSPLSWWRRWVIGGAVAILIVVAGVAVTNRTGGPSYRTASVERADVDATLDALGTIQPINQANLSFPVTGNVSGVTAAVGQHVTVGQTLAQLDTTSLNAQVASAHSAVAAAQARLAADGSSQTATSTAAVAPAAFTTQSPADPTAAARELVTTQQARLIADQHRADQDLATEQRDLKTETDLCQAWVTATDSATATTPPSPSPGTTPKSRSTVLKAHAELAIPRSPDASGCAAALQTVLADQVAVSHDQQAVAANILALDNAITTLLTSAQASNQSQPQQHTSTTGSTTGGASRSTATPTAGALAARAPTSSAPAARAPAESTPATRAPAGGANRATPSRPPASAEQLAADQAAIDAAQAQLVEAQQAHDQAELRSPIDGTVGSVTISLGQSVPGNLGTPQIVIIGPGAHQVITSISDTAVSAVRVGDAATVTPSGSSASLRGQVVSIGLLASGSANSSGSVSYPITIGLTGTEQQLFAGQSAAVSLMLAHVSGALTVPSSAVHHAGATTIVSVLRAGTVSPVTVTTGAVGPTRTEVLSGLNPGDQVILADLSQPLPTTTLQNARRLTTGGGGRPGG